MDVLADDLRLNIGCGRHTVDGWFCIDAAQHPLADRPLDLVSDIRKIALPDQCASEIVAIHIWEHLARSECDATIVEWRRLLKLDGLLSMEMPDLLKCSRSVLHGAKVGDADRFNLGMEGLYGDARETDPLMLHRWSWTFGTLEPFLASYGFYAIKEQRAQWHVKGREHRDFRIEARKAG